MAIFTAIGTYLTATFGATIAGIIGNLAIGAALIGAQQLLGGAQGKAQTSTPQAQATINQSAGPRIRGYGKALLGGTRAFWDSKNGTLYQIVMAHHGRIEGFELFRIGDTYVSVGSGGEVLDPPFNTSEGPYVYIAGYIGGKDQVADPTMIADWPGIWTSEHRLRGIAYWRVMFLSPPADKYQAIFPDGPNTPVTCICKLSLVWDPRDADQEPDDESSWKWNDNAALCILDYLRHPDGYRKSVNDIDIESFSAFADVCDEQVPIAAGGTEPRYRIWGVYSLQDDPADVLGKMRAACDAEFYQTPQGKMAIRGGKWEAPTVTLREADIISHSLEQGNDRFSAFNELQVTYTSADHDFQTVETTPWVDLADQEDRGPLPSELNLDMVPTASQARRLAKIHIAKSNPAWKGTIDANLAALDGVGERTIRLVLPELQIDDAFFIAGIRPVIDDQTGIPIGVQTTVMSISEASYRFSVAEEGQAAPVPPDTSPDPGLPVPSGLVLSKVSSTITATVGTPDRTDLTLHVQFRAGAGSIWQDMSPIDQTHAKTGTLTNGTYQARARWRGPLNSAGDWTSPLAEITLP